MQNVKISETCFPPAPAFGWERENWVKLSLRKTVSDDDGFVGSIGHCCVLGGRVAEIFSDGNSGPWNAFENRFLVTVEQVSICLHHQA